MLRAVVFDLDGTLVDDVSIHVEAWKAAFEAYGIPISREAIHAQIGKGSGPLIETLLQAPSPELVEGIRHAHERFFRSQLDRITAFPGAADLLAALRRRHLLVALVTSSQSTWIFSLLEQVGLSFDAMVTAVDVKKTKPDPEPFRKVLEGLQLEPQEVLAIGDAPYDAEGASSLNIRCLGVLTGGFSEAELKQAGACFVFRDVEGILKELDALLAWFEARMAA